MWGKSKAMETSGVTTVHGSAASLPFLLGLRTTLTFGLLVNEGGQQSLTRRVI